MNARQRRTLRRRWSRLLDMDLTIEAALGVQAMHDMYARLHRQRRAGFRSRSFLGNLIRQTWHGKPIPQPMEAVRADSESIAMRMDPQGWWLVTVGDWDQRSAR